MACLLFVIREVGRLKLIAMCCRGSRAGDWDLKPVYVLHGNPIESVCVDFDDMIYDVGDTSV